MNQIVIAIASEGTTLWQSIKPFGSLEEAYAILDQLRDEASRRVALLFVQALQNELRQQQTPPSPPSPPPADPE